VSDDVAGAPTRRHAAGGSLRAALAGLARRRPVELVAAGVIALGALLGLALWGR